MLFFYIINACLCAVGPWVTVLFYSSCWLTVPDRLSLTYWRITLFNKRLLTFIAELLALLITSIFNSATCDVCVIVEVCYDNGGRLWIFCRIDVPTSLTTGWRCRTLVAKCWLMPGHINNAILTSLVHMWHFRASMLACAVWEFRNERKIK